MRSSGVYFSELKLRLRSVASARSSWCFVLLIAAIQAAVSLMGGPDRVSWIYETLGLNREGVLSGKVWQLLTYGLLHGGVVHLMINAFGIVMIGARIEHVLGPQAVWKMLGWGMLGGAAGHLLVAPGGAGAPLLVGASGAFMGLLILLTTLSPESRMWPLPVSAHNLAIGLMGAELLLALIDPALGLPGFSLIGEALVKQGLAGWFALGHACHFGGGMAGFVYGTWLLRPGVNAARLRRERERREARAGRMDQRSR